MFSVWLIILAPNRLVGGDLLIGNRALFSEPSYLSDFTGICSILVEKPVEIGKRAFVGQLGRVVRNGKLRHLTSPETFKGNRSLLCLSLPGVLYILSRNKDVITVAFST